MSLKFSQNFVLLLLFFIDLCGCDSWPLAPKEHRLRAFENEVLRRIFGPK
jgi:hypothetical protein